MAATQTSTYTAEQRKVVRRIMQLRGEGNGYPAIASALNARKVAPFGGGKQWYGPTVRHIVIREAGGADAALKLAATARPDAKRAPRKRAPKK